MNLYQDLAGQFRKMIEDGTLAYGEKLPSVRKLSKARGLSVTTVLEAYRKLEDSGLIEARAKSGFYVALRDEQETLRMAPAAWMKPVPAKVSNTMPQLIRQHSQADLIHLSIANPEPEILPVKALGRITREVIRTKGASTTGYSDPQGDFLLRRKIVGLMLERGVAVSLDDIVVTNGCQEALYLAFLVLAERPGLVAVESPCYPGALQALELVGSEVIEIPSHSRTGIDLGALERAVAHHPVSAVYVMPRCANPSGASMSNTALENLYQLACRHNLILVEDDTNWGLKFRDNETPPLKAIDRENRVIYCCSLSKSLAPGLRIGWMIAEDLCPEILEAKYVLNMGGSSVSQQVAAKYIEEKRFHKDLEKIRRAHQGAVIRLVRCVKRYFPKGVRFAMPTGGFTVWVKLPEGVDGEELRVRALQRKVSIAPGEIFSPRKGYRNFVRMGWGGIWNDAAEKGVKLVGKACEELLTAHSR